MIEVYWGCLIFGALFAIVAIIFGDFIGHLFGGLFDFLPGHSVHFIQPTVVVGAVTVFGGAGIVLTEYSSLSISVIVLLSLLLAVLLSICIYFLYVKPMRNTENSTGFSIQDFVGRIGEVMTPIPPAGYGEILVKMGAGNTHQIAASFDKEAIEAGTRVVIIDVKDDTLLVSRYEDM
ncbi:NfeD family protein [Aneurinibacillus tyrosinisolvens]|uniref:NfeD family protein n=1 Tax=Aneurinibacillus tyrosinisolvens TaxID=1443435 RepID=UPI00063F1105|nr:NfeD family protein [Aneurinibacillus tyrosinisolvens]